MAVNTMQQFLLLLALMMVRLSPVFCQCDSNDAFVDEGYPLAVGRQVRFVLQSAGRGYNGWLTFALCSRQSCSAASVVDNEENNGRLVFRELTTATNAPTAYITVKREVVTTVPSLSKGLNYSFVMERTNRDSFALWIEGGHSFQMFVHTEPNQLRIKWATNLGVIYSVPASARGDYVMSEGQDVKLKLVTAEKQRTYTSLVVGLCSQSACDKASLYSASEGPQPRLAYDVSRSAGNYLIGPSTVIQPRTGPDGHFPGNRNYTFVIRRRQGAVDIWLDGSPDSQMTFASNNTILRVLSWVGSTHFVYEGREKVLRKFGSTCGRTIGPSDTLAINGIKIPIQKTPWHAAIYLRQRNGTWTGQCSGTLVTPSIVVTAAHCVAFDSGKPFAAENISVALAKTRGDFEHPEEATDETIFRSLVKEIHMPSLPKWYRGPYNNHENDIAVLELFDCATLGDRIFPICIDDAIRSEENELLLVSGWGNGLNNPFKADLESVELPYVSIRKCLELMDSTPTQIRFVTNDKFCSYRNVCNPAAQGILEGDSGGGAFIKRDGRWYFQGVVSQRAVATKDNSLFHVYMFTDLTHHLGWISHFLTW